MATVDKSNTRGDEVPRPFSLETTLSNKFTYEPVALNDPWKGGETPLDKSRLFRYSYSVVFTGTLLTKTCHSGSS